MNIFGFPPTNEGKTSKKMERDIKMKQEKQNNEIEGTPYWDNIPLCQ